MRTNAHQGSGTGLYDLEAAAADAIDLSELYELVDDDLEIDASNDTDEANGGVELRFDWDEPEPLVDAASDLGELLYPPDDSITDLSLELKIDELLMRVTPIDKAQREQCRELLRVCGLRRLRHLLPWLHRQTWQGTQLLLFLEFREHWGLKTNAQWWEVFQWSEREQNWMPRYERRALTLHHSWALVHKRTRYTVNQVIDDEWLRDWDSSAAWELGVRSFADFAVFRSEIPAGDNWLEYLVRRDGRDALEVAQYSDPTFAPFMLPSFTEQYSFSARLPTEPDPWPRIFELAEERALALGVDISRVWHDVLNESMYA